MKKTISKLMLLLILISSFNVGYAEEKTYPIVTEDGINIVGYYNPQKKAVRHKIKSYSEFRTYIHQDLENFEQNIIFDVTKNIKIEEIERLMTTQGEIIVTGVDPVSYGIYYLNPMKKNQIKIEIEYSISEKQQAELKKWVKDWVGTNITKDMTDEQKVDKIYSYIIDNYKYYDDDLNDKSKEYAMRYSTYSMIGNKKAVCNAFSGMFRMLAKEAGVKVIDIVGYLKDNENENENGYHAWNLVRINGVWRHVDPTFGISYKEEGEKDLHYLVKDSDVTDRTWNKKYYPVAQ